MDELVTIIEQRNHIISCLDQDRQRYLRKKKSIMLLHLYILSECNFVFLIRERENNVLWEDVMNKGKITSLLIKALWYCFVSSVLPV